MRKIFFIVILVAILAAFFASSNPDGLDRTAKMLGFAQKGIEYKTLMTGYSIPLLPEGGLSTAIAGIVGVLITLGVFLLAIYLITNALRVLIGLILIWMTGWMTGQTQAARPLVTDDFGTVNPGKYELEVGYSSETLVSFKRGLTSNFDFGVEVPYSLTAPTRLGDAALHAKYKLMVMGEDEGLTARLDVKLPNVTGFTDYSLSAIYSKKFSDFKTHYNLGHTLIGDPTETNKSNYAAAMEKEVSPGIDIVGEYYAVSTSGGSTSNVQVGGRWQALEAVRFDAGYSLALNDNSNNVITTGLTAEF